MGRPVHRPRDVGEVERAGLDETGDVQSERIAAVAEIVGGFLDGAENRRNSQPGEVGRDMQADHGLAGAAFAGNERGAAFRNAAVRQDVETRHSCRQFAESTHAGIDSAWLGRWRMSIDAACTKEVGQDRRIAQSADNPHWRARKPLDERRRERHPIRLASPGITREVADLEVDLREVVRLQDVLELLLRLHRRRRARRHVEHQLHLVWRESACLMVGLCLRRPRCEDMPDLVQEKVEVKRLTDDLDIR